MPVIVTRRKIIAHGLALGAAVIAPRARACEFYASNLRITHPWTRATRQDAPYAVVCMKIDEVTQADRLIGVTTPVARSAGLHGIDGGTDEIDFAIAPSVETLFGEGRVQLRLFGLNHALEVARAYPMVLTFAHGGNVKTDLSVDYARFK